MLKLLKRREITLVVIILVLLAAVSLRAPGFLKLGNLDGILTDTAILLIVSIGQMMVIVTGGADLSVASGLALTGMSVAMLNWLVPSIPIPVIVALALVIGFVLGSFNGFLVSVAKIPPIITTLATMGIYRGIVFLESGGQWVSAHKMTESFRELPHYAPLGISNLLLAAVVVAIIAAVFIRYTRTGREIYGAGGNRTAARYVGISLARIDFLVYAISGVLVGLAGLLWVARYASAQNDTATGFELQTIAACVIGGVSMLGGSGSLVGVVLGALFLGIVNNALPVIGLSPFFQMAIQGFVILAAIIANSVVDHRAQAMLLRTRKL
ncbi:MAG: ABC transporter permease [Spirochaetia bacterium]|jgi:rhamnose transport system permease protein